MLVVIVTCAALVAFTVAIHYEMLRFVNAALPSLSIPGRSKVLVVIFAAFVAHALEIAVYGTAVWVLVSDLGLGSLTGAAGFLFQNCLYFSAETYTSLGFGDLAPVGPVRLLAGVEALNGLLLIAWSASYTYLAMERFWGTEGVYCQDAKRKGVRR